jgi:hypothetical protein
MGVAFPPLGIVLYINHVLHVSRSNIKMMTTVWMVSMLLMANLLTCILRIYYRKEFTVRTRF